MIDGKSVPCKDYWHRNEHLHWGGGLDQVCKLQFGKQSYAGSNKWSDCGKHGNKWYTSQAMQCCSTEKCPNVVHARWKPYGHASSGDSFSFQTGWSNTESKSTTEKWAQSYSEAFKGGGLMWSGGGSASVSHETATTWGQSMTNSGSTTKTVTVPKHLANNAVLWQLELEFNAPEVCTDEHCEHWKFSTDTYAWTGSTSTPPVCGPDSVCTSQGASVCDPRVDGGKTLPGAKATPFNVQDGTFDKYGTTTGVPPVTSCFTYSMR